jgi:hypothetical protein
MLEPLVLARVKGMKIVTLLTVCIVTFIHIYTSGYIGFPGKRETKSYEINDSPMSGKKMKEETKKVW